MNGMNVCVCVQCNTVYVCEENKETKKKLSNTLRSVFRSLQCTVYFITCVQTKATRPPDRKKGERYVYVCVIFIRCLLEKVMNFIFEENNTQKFGRLMNFVQ